MRVLLVHNFYQQAGGEDVVLREEAALLEAHGNQIKVFSVTNDDISGFFDAVKIGLDTSYSKTSRDRLSAEIGDFKPDIVHVHNFFPILTPSIYDACQTASVPVVQTLHNFRTICAGALLLRDGKVCEKCLSASPYMGAVHGCYRGSILASIPVARMIAHHKKARTWENKVNAFIVLTEFAKQKFIEGGLPKRKLYVKPNFLPDKFKEIPGPKNRLGGLFVGRLSKEKGVDILLDAWEGLDYPLRIAGEGPLEGDLRERAGKNVIFLGQLSKKQVLKEMAKAAFLVMPSINYETFGLTIVEAMSMETPVIASNIGAMKEIVESISEDLVFTTGSGQSLHERIEWAIANSEELRTLGRRSRREFLDKYVPEKNYKQLIRIYQAASA